MSCLGTAIAAGFGLASMVAMLVLLRTLLRMQSKGNLDYCSVVGHKGAVYVTIPGGDEDGGGQIQINTQGRYTTASARKGSTAEFISGLVRSLPPLHEITQNAGVALPDFLGKPTGGKEATAKPSNRHPSRKRVMMRLKLDNHAANTLFV